ncbi:integral membrane protein [Penicillium alfredii]|uniref:Integral membrane protein n=1 Tax=Penicillium alfredii TaxID=1506179 RepID=A0A9W9ERA6_9EURO|nr:uncharacterized protein NUU61_007733 [Penicillium alfredii]KAJ5086426.1 integral membrane protein [Penicillium alfredii]
MSTHASDSGVAGDFYHPNQKLRVSITIALVFAFLLSTVAVALRILARKINGSKLFLDDYLIIIALLFKYGCSIGVTMLLWNGLGSHITMIPKKNLTVFFKIGWSNPFVYTSCVAFIKLSILALYKRLFSVRHIVWAVNFLAGFVILWAVSIIVANSLMCIPVNKFWDQEIEGACIDTAKFYYGQQIPNILSDICILILPLKVVWDLPIAKTQKGLLSGVFLVGGLTLIFDIVRLVEMIKLTKAGPDITYNQVPTVMWTCTEAAVGIVAACLPNLRPLFRVGGRGFWSQLRSSSNRSGKSHLNTTTNTDTSTCVSHTTSNKRVESPSVTEETVETHRYSDYMQGVKA